MNNGGSLQMVPLPGWYLTLTEHKPATEAREASTTHVYGMNRSADWKQEKAAKGCGPVRLPVPTQWAWPHQGGR